MLADGVVRVLDFGMGAYLGPARDRAQDHRQHLRAGEFRWAVQRAPPTSTRQGFCSMNCTPAGNPSRAANPAAWTRSGEKRLLFRFRPGRSFPGAQPSEKLDAILARCLEYPPSARFQSAMEVLEALSEADVFQTMQEALLSGRYDYALALSEKALAASPPAERRVFCLKTRADALTTLGRNGEALEALKAAIETAEQTGAFVRTPSDWNALIDAICLVYTKMGQAGMARIFARKKR